MALYMPHSIFHLARLLYVRPENFGPYYVLSWTLSEGGAISGFDCIHVYRFAYSLYVVLACSLTEGTGTSFFLRTKF